MSGANTEFWRWSEVTWRSPDLEWREAAVISAGIDVGSVSSQAVVLADGKLLSYHSTRTGSNSPDSAARALAGALDGGDIRTEDIRYLVGTGYGRVNVPFAHRTLTEIACHAAGANYMAGPSVRTILDMGGQDCKVIRCDEKGKVISFVMNDKCAAGTGRGMEVIADVLGVPIEEIGPRSLDVEEEPPAVSSVCTVFAKSEATLLLKQGWSVNAVLAAYCGAMAKRVAALIQRVSVEPEFFITGGIAKNVGVVRRIENLIGAKALRLPQDSPLDPQIAGALGAALFARALYLKGRGKPTSAGNGGDAAARSGDGAGTSGAAG